jgi:hypothetical protein
LLQTPSPSGALLTFATIIRWGPEKNRYGLPRGFIKKKYMKRLLRRCLHTQSSIARRFAQTRSVKRDVLAKTRDGQQSFVPRCVFRATFAAVNAIIFYDKKTSARISYFFSMKTTAIVHRRYMS